MPWHLAIIGLQALDDDLPLIVDRVDDERAARADLGLDHAARRRRTDRRGAAVAELLADVDQRHNPPRSEMTRASRPSPWTSLCFGLSVSTIAVSGTTSV